MQRLVRRITAPQCEKHWCSKARITLTFCGRKVDQVRDDLREAHETHALHRRILGAYSRSGMKPRARSQVVSHLGHSRVSAC